MYELNIVLVEPQIPQNTGNIARTCAAIGARLHLVQPMGFTIDNAKLRRAGLDYWQYLDIIYYQSLEEFLLCTMKEERYFFSTKGQYVYSQVCYCQKIFLIFGREDAGLPEKLLMAYPQRCIRLPMQEGLRSLNLSNTVAIGAYEALRQWGFPRLQNKGKLHQYKWEDINLD